MRVLRTFLDEPRSSRAGYTVAVVLCGQGYGPLLSSLVGIRHPRRLRNFKGPWACEKCAACGTKCLLRKIRTRMAAGERTGNPSLRKASLFSADPKNVPHAAQITPCEKSAHEWQPAKGQATLHSGKPFSSPKIRKMCRMRHKSFLARDPYLDFVRREGKRPFMRESPLLSTDSEMCCMWHKSLLAKNPHTDCAQQKDGRLFVRESPSPLHGSGKCAACGTNRFL